MRRFLAIVALAACARPGAQYQVHQPAQIPANEGSFARASRALISKGLEIETSDKESGMLTTAWVQDDFMSDKRRFRWVVTIDETFVTVTSQCQTIYKDSMSVEQDVYEECRDGLQPERRNTEAQALADAMVGR